MDKAQPRKEKEGSQWSQKDQSIEDEKERRKTNRPVNFSLCHVA